MLGTTGVLLALPALIWASPLLDSLQMNNFVPDTQHWALCCDSRISIQNTIKPQLSSYNELSVKCWNHYQSLPFYCDKNRIRRLPDGRLKHQFDLSRQAYLDACKCIEITEQDNISVTKRQPPPWPGLSTSASDANSGQASQNDLTYHWDYCHCDDVWYGHPDSVDCFIAIQQLPNYHSMDPVRRELHRLMGPYPSPAPGVDGPPLQTPIVKQFRSCTAVVFLPSNLDTRQNVVVNLGEMNQAATFLVDKCPGDEGKGGRFHHSPETRSRYLAIHGDQLPEIVLFGTNSLAQAILNRLYACSKDVRGNTKCKPRVRAPHKQAGASEQVVQPRPGLPQSSQQTSKSGPCWSQADCDIESNYVCASDRGRCSIICYQDVVLGFNVLQHSQQTTKDLILAENDFADLRTGFGTSSSNALPAWGSHMCINVAGAAFARTLTKSRGATCTSGRCLLESDGTLDIASPSNTSAGSPAETADFNPFTNMTNLDVEGLVDAFENAIASNSSTASHSYTRQPGGDRFSDLGSPLTPTGSKSSELYEPTPIPQLDSAGHITPSPGSSLLNCPCNCTYVSAACCLSDGVWEDASFKIQMAPLPAYATVTCDDNSGKWVPKAKGSQSTATIVGDFDDIGSVPYKKSPPAATYLPKTGGG